MEQSPGEKVINESVLNESIRTNLGDLINGPSLLI